MQKPRPSGTPMLGRVRVRLGRTKAGTRGRLRRDADIANTLEADRQAEASRFLRSFVTAAYW